MRISGPHRCPPPVSRWTTCGPSSRDTESRLSRGARSRNGDWQDDTRAAVPSGAAALRRRLLRGLLCGEDVDHEPQRARRVTLGGGVRAVGEVDRDVELDPAAHLLADQTLIPALDHPALAEREGELGAVRPGRVELLTVDVGDPDVVDG